MLFSVIKVLYFYISTFPSMCTLPGMAVFYSSLMSCFLGKFSDIFCMILR
jgi:hypothetical protein